MEEINELHMVPGSCAVCKHLRRRCDESCVLGQYFPSERAEDFENVHRIFGIQNAVKILASVAGNETDKTVETLILEAKIRLENPVHGAVAVERKLRAELEELKKELHMVKHQLQFFRGHGEVPLQQAAAPPPDKEPDPAGNFDDISS